MRLLIIGISVCFLVACEDSSQSQQSVEATVEDMPVEKVSAPATTIKPGAAVVFTSEFAGNLEVGEMAPLVVQLSPEYPSGTIEVEIRGEQGLMVVGQTRFSEAFSGDYQFSKEVQVGAVQAGEYYLSIVVNVDADNGLKEARAFTETILVVDSIAAPLADKVEEAVRQIEAEVETRLPALEQIITR
jgi:hypothetical protein